MISKFLFLVLNPLNLILPFAMSLDSSTIFLEWGGTSGPLPHARHSHPNAHPMALRPYPPPSL